MARRAEPVRTCVGCRTRAARSDLLRIVVVGGELLPDVRRRMRGRGAHLHPDPACLDLAERRRAFPRALRVSGPLGLNQVRAHVAEVERVLRTGAGPGTDDGAIPHDGGVTRRVALADVDRESRSRQR
jgi:predicted RNA-binding protein YlxR (DUF448 family)